MQYKITKLILSLCLSLQAINAEDILSPEQVLNLDLSYDKAISESKKLKKDTIEPIIYTYSYNDDDQQGILNTSTLTINQAIFRSGGIYYSLKYAENLKKSNLLSLEIQKKSLLTQALSLAYTIKKLELQIKAQELLIDNAKIDVKVKKEQVLNGLTDTSLLNNAILSLNQQREILLELSYQKENSILEFSNLSNKEINQLKIPKFSSISHETFMEKNLDITKSEKDILVQDNLKNITRAQYLPSLSVRYSKTYYHESTNSFSKNTDNDSLGFSVTVPFAIGAFDDYDSSKASYLIAKNELLLKKQEAINFFKSKKKKISMIEMKKDLTVTNIQSYDELLNQMRELANAGLRTSDDVKILENSKANETFKLEILEYDIQLELLQIYGKIESDTL